MQWNGGFVPIYQIMWYAQGMGKGTARPYIGTTCYPSATI